MFCRNCGTKIHEGQSECHACGTKVSNVSLQSIQSYNQQTQKRPSNFIYLVIICFLLGVIGMLSVEAFGNHNQTYQEKYPEIIPDVSPETDDEEPIPTRRRSNAIVETSKNSYHSNGYIFEIPDNFDFQTEGEEAYAELPDLGIRFNMRAYPGTVVSLSASIEYIKERFESYGYTNISSETATHNGVKYYIIFFNKDNNQYARIISVVNEELLLQTDCLLNLTKYASPNYYVDLITSIITEAKVETTSFNKEQPIDFFEATEELNDNLLN